MIHNIRRLFLAPVHTLVGMAFVVATAGSVASFALAESSQFTPVVESDVIVQQRGHGHVLGVSTPSVIAWTHLTNVIAEEGDLEQVTGYCVGCADAGAHSSQKITAGDGYFEFTIAPGTYHYVYAGLNTDTSASTSAAMPFAFEISGSYVSIREQGVYKSDTSFVAGDVFRVSVESGVVKYYKNSTQFYTSLAKPTYPLVADVSMQSVGSLLWGGKIAMGDTIVAPSAPVIVSFAASPTSITVGQSTRLSWGVAGATFLSVDQGVGVVTGATGETVTPTSTTTYTLTATGEGGTTVSIVTVNVAPVEVPPSTSVCNTVVPRGQFIGCYYNNKDLTSFKFSRTDAYPLSFAWGKGSPSRLISSDTFSVVWTGQFDFENTPYTFTTTVDDGVRVYVDGSLIIDKWSDMPGTHTATVSPGVGTHVVRMDYYENRGSAKVSLSWNKLGTPPAPVPAISSFTASPASITSGSSTLTWTVSGATSLSINQGIGTVTGTTSKVVTPTATTTYTLTAMNSSGSVTASATVTVNAVTPTTIVDGYGDALSLTQFNGWFFSQVGDTGAVITYENIADTTRTYTQTASRTMPRPDAETWLKATYGTNFTITQPLGFSVNPSTVVTAPGTYRIKSIKLNTSNTNILLGPSAQGTFTVGAPVTPPDIYSFTASPFSITAGQSATLAWNVSGATSLFLNQNIGTVTGTTSKVVTPTATTTYTLTATNSSGIAATSVTVIVNTVVVPPPTTSAVELPRVYVNSSYPSLPSNRTIRSVKASCGAAANCYSDFQAALNAAVPGDEVVLDAGYTAVAPSGGFVLPNKGSTEWIVIRSVNISNLPAAGTRVSPSYASQMPKILTNDNLAAIQTSSGASYYRFVGIEVSATNSVTTNSGLIMLGSAYETNAASQAHHIIFDRSYVHGNNNGETRRGFFLNSGETAIVDSYVSGFVSSGSDAQAILGANGPGPLKVMNNYLEASGENFMIGGIDAAIQGVQMSDVEFRGNLVAKQSSWRGSSLVVKNLFELKNGQRILIDGNIFEYNWSAAQSGMALNIKTVNQDGGMTWAETKNVTITNNIIRHANLGVVVVDRDNNGPSGSTNNVYVAHNIFDDISNTRWGAGGYGGSFILSLGATNNVTFSHNTAIHDGSTITVDGSPAQNFKFTDNISFLGGYGIKGSGAASGTGTITMFFPGGAFSKNVMVGDGTGYPTGNFYPTNVAAVGFTNYNGGIGGDYTLNSSSVYRNAASDGTDVGARISAVNAATVCVMSGVCGGVTPPAPVPAISSFTASPASITSGSSTLTWTVSGATSLSINQGIGTVTGTTSKVVTPTATTTYTLTAMNSSGSVTASATVTVNAVTPTTIVDGYGDALSLTQFNGWFFSQVGDTGAVITYENIADTTRTYTQTASRTMPRPDAETWLKATYGTNFTITQPLGFSVNPSTVVTAPGTYRIKSIKLNTSNTNILLGPSAQGTFTVGGTPPITTVAYGVDFATYFGGDGYDSIRDITTDAGGNIYVVGGTQSTDFPRTMGQNLAGSMDVFVTKLSSAGQIIWSQLLGGQNYDRAYGVELDSQGNIYISGRSGRGFPMKNAFQPTFSGYNTGAAYGEQNLFLAKLNPSGTVLWSTYVGTADMARDLAVDANGNIYLASNYTPALGQGAFPTAWFTNAFQKVPQGGVDEVIIKVDTNGTRVQWATYLGGSGDENPKISIRVDGSGNLMILSDTSSSNAPVVNAYQSVNRLGPNDAYLVKMKPDGTGLLWATFFGGTGSEYNETHHLGVDTLGNTYIVIMTQSTDAPTTVGAYDRTYNGEGGGALHAYGDTLAAKFNSFGQLIASTYVGGSGGDGPQGVGVDVQGNVYFSGGTTSANFPVTAGAAVTVKQGGVDVFGARLSSDLSKVDYATYIGTSGNEEGRVIWADGAGSFYVGCEVANSGMQPLTNALQPNFGGGAQDACVAKFSLR